MQTHRCHQYSLESHHSGQRIEHIESCCTESLDLSMRLCICNSWWRIAIREPKGTSIPTYFCELETYGSFSHHFHQSMSWSQYIVKRRRCTDRWYTETGWTYNLSWVQNEWIGKHMQLQNPEDLEWNTTQSYVNLKEKCIIWTWTLFRYNYMKRPLLRYTKHVMHNI